MKGKLMNDFQYKLYNNLLALTQNYDDFSFREFPQADGTSLRIFNYRLGSYSVFMQPDGMNCRGTLFEVAADGTPLKLLALPMPKFFGRDENPLTMNLDFSEANIIYAADKLDGSLMSTYIHESSGGFKVKSKNGLASKEVAAVMQLLNTPEYAGLKADLEYATSQNITVDLEYTGPENRIVLEYAKPAVSVLSMRNMENGCMGLPQDFFEDDFCARIEPYMVKTYKPAEVAAILEKLDEIENFEGLVVCVRDKQGQPIMVKCKSMKYYTLHHAVDAVNFIKGITEVKRLYACVVYEVIDDFKSIFRLRPEFDLDYLFEAIDSIEAEVVPKFNAMIANVEAFVAENKHLEKSEFARKGSAIKDGFFNLKMAHYLGNEVDYRTFAIKNMSLFFKGLPKREKVGLAA